jgi:hypothetical protein
MTSQASLGPLDGLRAFLGAIASRLRPPMPSASNTTEGGRTTPPAATNHDTARWTRSFYRHERGGRQLRLTLSRSSASEGEVRRQVVVLRVRRSGSRKREAAFDLPGLARSRLSAREMDAVVEQSFAEARALLQPAASRP